MPAAFGKPALDKLYKRLKNLDYTQVDEMLAVMLSVILQLEAKGECEFELECFYLNKIVTNW